MALFLIGSLMHIIASKGLYFADGWLVGSCTLCQFFLPLCYAHMLSFCPVILTYYAHFMLTFAVQIPTKNQRMRQFSSLSDLKSMVACNCKVEVNTAILG